VQFDGQQEEYLASEENMYKCQWSGLTQPGVMLESDAG